MTLQASGAISFTDLQAEFGGANPIGLSEYYRNGSYVPSQVTVRDPASGENYSTSTWWETQDNAATRIKWGGTVVRNLVSGAAASYTISGYTYYRGSLRSTTYGYSTVYHAYGVYRTSVVTVNANIPASGQISLSQFYGGRKT